MRTAKVSVKAAKTAETVEQREFREFQEFKAWKASGKPIVAKVEKVYEITHEVSKRSGKYDALRLNGKYLCKASDIAAIQEFKA